MTLPRDLDHYLPHGTIKDYPVDHDESSNHFGDAIKIGVRLSHKLTESELFNVVCENGPCRPSYPPYLSSGDRSFGERMTYTDWIRHHSSSHPNAPSHFSIVSFWSTCFDGYGYDTEYRLVSMDPSDRDLVYLKPLDTIYSNDEDKKRIIKRCSYCHSTKGKALRCGGCKILFYCNTECQSKHWKLVHKWNCKKYRKKYKKRALSQEEMEEIDATVTLGLSKLMDDYVGDKVDRFSEMIAQRARTHRQESGEKEIELLVPERGEDDPINTIFVAVMKAFDRDRDGKLCFEEWKSMWQALGFRTIADIQRIAPFASWERLFYVLADTIGLLPKYEPSLSSGVYGSYLYPNAAPILLGATDIIDTLIFGAWLKSNDPTNEDPDWEEQFDLEDRLICNEKALRTLQKLLGHAYHITFHGHMSQEKVYDAIMEAVPFLDKDIVSIIYDFQSNALSHFINVSWHRIQWGICPEDLEGLWNEYDRESGHQHFDLFYLKKQNDSGFESVVLQIEICNDIKRCNKKLDCVSSNSYFGFSQSNMMDKMEQRQRWTLGSCSAYIPSFSFLLQDHAKLIGKVLNYNGLNPARCHYIYIGVGFHNSIEDKEMIVNHYRDIFGSQTKFRPHAPKRPSGLLGVSRFC